MTNNTLDSLIEKGTPISELLSEVKRSVRRDQFNMALCTYLTCKSTYCGDKVHRCIDEKDKLKKRK